MEHKKLWIRWRRIIALLGSGVWIPIKEFVKGVRITSSSRVVEGHSLCVVGSRDLTWFEELTGE
jgi:hypothetical protein